VGELEAEEPAAGLENPEGLPQRRVAVRDVPDAKRDGVGIERAVLELGERLGVALAE
jgi:hypothetical protein